MDLEKELLAVLDNPSEVWSAVMTHLSAESRTILHVFTTCSAPVSLVEWQNATARVSTDAAVGFEEALRSLDDTFISLELKPHGLIAASYRNPSMDDFCADSLNKNVGFARTIAEKSPTIHQVRRLMRLATAMRGTRLKYPSLHEALIKDPALILKRLLVLVEEEGEASVAEDILRLAGTSSNVSTKDLQRIKDRIGRTLQELYFGGGSALRVYAILDSPDLVVGLKRILGSDFPALYRKIWQSASSLTEFDSVVNVDWALDIDGSTAEWREHFESMSDSWDPEGNQETDLSDIETSRDYYSKIAEHLDLKGLDFTEEWEALVRRSEEREQERYEREEQQREEWVTNLPKGNRESSGGLRSILSEEVRPDPIDAMFEGLLSSDREVDAED